MKFRFQNLWKIIILMGLILLIIFRFDDFLNVIRLIFTALIPIILGIVFAFILNILMEKIEKNYFPKSDNRWVNKTRRPVSIILSILIVGIVIYIVGILVIPEFINTIQTLILRIPELAQMAWDFAQERGLDPSVLGVNPDLWDPNSDLIQNTINLSRGFLGRFINIASSFIGVVVNVVLGLVFAVYILSSKEKLYRNVGRVLKAYLPTGKVTTLYRNASIVNESFKYFFTGQFIEAILLGVLTTVLMFVFRFPYPTMIGSVVGLTNVIPILGPFIGGFIGFLLMLTVDPVKALWFILFVLLLQQLEGNILYPKVVGSSIGVGGLWVFGAVTLGTGLFGVAGAILAVPIVASIYKILKYNVEKIEEGRRKEIRKKQDNQVIIQ